MVNFGSRRVLGFILVEGGKDINSDHVLSYLEKCIKETKKTWQPNYVSFDQHAAQMSEDLRSFF